MSPVSEFTVTSILKQNKKKVAITWLLVALENVFMVLLPLFIVSVARRFYDTRVDAQSSTQDVSVRNARLDMSCELVDFLENDIPPLMTAAIQLISSIAFHIKLGISAVVAGLAILIVYACSHDAFMRLNGTLNNRMERQVSILSTAPFAGVRRHLEKLKRREVMISDIEAIVHGIIFLFLFAFVTINLWLSTNVHAPTASE